MTDERLNELLDDASRTYRVPPEPDVAAMWAAIERDAFVDHPRWRRWAQSPSWRVLVVGMAATLVLGIGLGRMMPNTSGPAVVSAPATDSAPRTIPAAYDRTATELLGRTAILLTALPVDGDASPRADARFASQARELLTTARLLLDSPASSDQRFKELLQDLELVLAQIARLTPGRGGEMEFITDALQERDVVPRIRSAVARLSLGDD
jgi:hypothetical protein